MKNTQRAFLPFVSSLLYVLLAGHPVLADDTEVLIGPGGQAWAKPNVLFVMDTSGSMGTVDDANVDPRSRLEIVQGVFADLMNRNSGFNVALMRFDSAANGGYFVSPMQELNASTRSGIINASNNFSAGGNTPLSETFYEAARFWKGMTVDYGDSSNPGVNVPATMDTDITAAGYTDNSANYISPINSQCQRNYTILLTDGIPTSDSGADSSVSTNFLGGSSCSGSGNGHCLDDIAGYLHTTDLSSGANGITGNQTAETYTIGFTTNQTLLQDTATAGGGDYIVADNASELTNAFADILQAIAGTNVSFSPPALAANSFSGVSHFNKLYLALFEPAATPKWDGNVKPYSINDDYDPVDADGGVATNPINGLFLETSRSFWSNSDDGASIAIGGANSRLPAAASRSLYTYTDDYDTTTGLVPDTPELTNTVNLLTDGNTDLTAELVGLPAVTIPTPANLATQATARSNIISTARSNILGAPLHSQPALVTYGGTDETDADLTLFVATNDGFLHALNASPSAEGTTDGGKELFAFIPKELLPNLLTLTSGTGTHPYGLDGDITVWVKESDADTDHTIESTEGDHVYVYVGMRRGGSNYYALDVTDRDEPTLKWVIRGGPGGTKGFEELGQTWSKPMLTTINYGSGTRKVLIFGGGYDTAQDANPLNNDSDTTNDDTIGRAVFIVDAEDGTLLWYTSPTASPTAISPAVHYPMSALTHSIPSDVRLLDSDLDDSTDRLYVGDMRGQVFRFDLRATATGMTASGIVLAKLGGPTEADNRRFFYSPDVVVTKRRGIPTYISVNIGSGYRAHPLNPLNANGTAAPRVNDRFYSLRDPNVLDPAPSTFDAITNDPTSLFDATNSLVTSATDIAALDAANGWYITLGAGNGEKVLASAVTVNGEILFTSYTPPESTSPAGCAPAPGLGHLYRVSLFDGSPVFDYNGDGDANDLDDRTEDKDRHGIPPGPTAVFRESSDGNVEIVLCVGLECEVLPDAIKILKAYWKEGS